MNEDFVKIGFDIDNLLKVKNKDGVEYFKIYTPENGFFTRSLGKVYIDDTNKNKAYILMHKNGNMRVYFKRTNRNNDINLYVDESTYNTREYAALELAEFMKPKEKEYLEIEVPLKATKYFLSKANKALTDVFVPIKEGTTITWYTLILDRVQTIEKGDKMRVQLLNKYGDKEYKHTLKKEVYNAAENKYEKTEILLTAIEIKEAFKTNKETKKERTITDDEYRTITK